MTNPLFPMSYSKLSMYETCPASVKFRSIEKVPTPKSPSAERGTDLHASIENFLLGNKTSIRKELVPLGKFLVKVKKNNPFVEEKLAFTHGFEKATDWKDPDAWFRMVMDSAYLKDDHIHIQEWKSGKIYDDHHDQRHIYALGGMIRWDLPATITTYYLDQHKTVPLRLDPGQRKLLAWQYTQRVEKVENEKHWAPRSGYYCRWCKFSRYKGGPCKIA